MAIGSEERLAVASAAVGAEAVEPDAVEYPEGQWVAQSVFHGVAVRLVAGALEHHFRRRDDVLVAMELRVYHRRGDKRTFLQPDVLVAFGVGRDGDRPTFRVWDEGKAPDFVLEVASPSTADNDAHFKAREYARIGVEEYWRIDPKGTIMGVPLEGYRAQGGRYRWVELIERAGGVEYLRSRVLGLDLRTGTHNGATVLVFRDPRTGEEFRSRGEVSERRRRRAEDWARAEAKRADAEAKRANAEANRARALEAKLTTASHQATAARQEATAARQEAIAARDELRVAIQTIRQLQQQLRDRSGRTCATEPDSEG